MFLPQMSPMWWTSLMLTFIVIFIILMTTLYYFYNEKMTGNISIPINKINWKW